MKKIILFILFFQSLILSSCGKYDTEKLDDNTMTDESVSLSDSIASQTESNIDETESYKNTDDSSAVEADAEIEENNSQNFDSVPVNEDIEAAVQKNNPEVFQSETYYDFSYNNFDMVYSSAELEKCFDKLNEICRTSDFSLAFSYQNIESGASVNYNSYTEYLTCSTIKAPYVKSLLENGIDLDDIIVKNSNWPGDTDPTDIVANMANGTEFTAKELIEYAIIDSDNTAYMLLHDTYGYMDFNNMQYELGANYIIGSDYIFTQASTIGMLKNYIDIYNFGKTDENGKWLIELMKNASYNAQIGQALGGKYDVAQKYGADSNENAFNDCAICYADSPFVLCIFTIQPPDDPDSCDIFKELAVVFDEINTLIYNAE